MPAATEPMIEVDDLSVTYGEGRDRVEALREVSFAVARGESFGLVGESGSGKSTVLRALAGLDSHWRGSIRIAGAVQGPRRPKAFSRTLQIVFQDPYGSLHPRHTVDRVLTEPLLIHGLGPARERVLEMLEAVGLGPAFRFRYPHQLSGGQRQRVAIARALMLEPEILLLDEPTSALDVSVQAEILNLLSRLKAERSLTYLLVSHDLAVIGHMCGRLAVMNAGRIVEALTVDQLRGGQTGAPYTAQLLRASAGYDRDAVETLVTYD